MPSAMTTDAAIADAGHAVKCLEVWGGTQAVETLLTLPGIDAWVYSRPYQGQEAGGDIHYVSSCFTGRVARFAVADVSGHGSEVAELSATLRRLMRKHINHLDQTGLARVLNSEFASLAQHGRFATAVLMSYFAPTDSLILCNAGHPSPLWYRAAEKTWTLLKHDSDLADDAAPNNLPLGIIEPTEYVQFTVKLGPGDVVVIYSDWLPETRGSDGRFLGEAGVLELAASLPTGDPAALGRGLLEATQAQRGGAASDDDQTLIVLHHNAGESPHQPVRGAIRYIADLLGLAGD